MKKKTPTIRYVIALAGLLFVCFSYYAYQIFETPNIQVDKKDYYLYIPTGANFTTVMDSLEKDQVLTDKLSFAFVSQLMGYQEKIKPGRYLLSSNSTNLTVIRKLKSGQQDPLKLTFNNVRTKKDLAKKLDEKLEFSEQDFLILVNDPKVVAEYGFDTNTVMAMFIPNTYQIFWNASPEEFLKKMNKEYKKFWNKDRLAKAKAQGYTPIQISIIASIVEAETNKDTEKSRIAGVYINRLKTDMPLQADPTVKYALQDFTIKRVTQEHTACISPYNTYKNLGLPPGPINMPSTVTIDAVLNAEKHKYVYFCASPNEIGYHDFAESYRDHVNNANRYRKYLDKQKIH
ncbi:MAG TPA: endolytic transglycosylase MltG [Cytophagaceae bacterium]|nr:endolytic transglycosylase MltG [Cytophagaceae bacterium]